MSSPSETVSESVFGSLLKKGKIDWNKFLETIWETRCHHFEFVGRAPSSLSSAPTPSPVGDLWSETVRSGWEVLTYMMDKTNPVPGDTGSGETNQESPEIHATGDGVEPPLLFRNLQPMDDPKEIKDICGNSMYAAYLAGFSIVWNHVDQISPEVAALCEDLQRHFPHAYANAYLTPPDSQTVPAHADDRDVLVFQLRGKKRWKVYQNVPVPHPYPHEQVGKAGIGVPESVMGGPLAFDGCLSPGDVLYLPRGMVHEASTAHSGTLDGPPDLSFHITVAIATHDWTLAGNLTRIVRTKLLETKVSDYSNGIVAKNNLRRSLLPKGKTSEEGGNLVSCGGSLVDAKALQAELDSVFEKLRSQITARSILGDIDKRIETHNARSSRKRRALASTKQRSQQQTASVNNHSAAAMDRVVGPIAARSVSLETLLRAATPIEKEYAQRSTNPGAPRAGLTVRDGVGDDVAAVVGAVKGGREATTRVGDFRSLCCSGCVPNNQSSLCDLTALSLAKRAVELGAFAVGNERQKSNSNDVTPNAKRQCTQQP